MPVVLISNRSLLAAGVESLLRLVDGVELSVISIEGVDAITTLRKLNPAVIVFDSGDSTLGEGMVTRLLGQHPDARVIALTLDPTGIEVYRVHRVVETNLDGLKEAIWGAPPFPAAEYRQETHRSADIENGGLEMDP
jgi:DNA-binding NarL/FixJ family response regulator